MCLKQLKVPTRANKIYRNTMPRIYNICRCGQCAECQQDIKNEYMYRTYYESIDTYNRGGYIIFDTLTYDENNVPWSKNIIKERFGVDIPNKLNFRCFDYRDVTLFHKRLRRNIERLYGPDIDKHHTRVKYMLAAEYGTKPGATHRPHYHVIYFVKDKNIDPYIFSQLVSDNWKLGRTDGLAYKGRAYFKNQRLFRQDTTGVNNAVGYISKYIAKDSAYSKFIRHQVHEIELYFDNLDKKYKETYPGHLRMLDIRRSLNQFHKNSQGYGERAFDYMDLERIFQDLQVVRPDAYKIKTSITLPMYYFRKLFQYYDKSEKVWKYNDAGKLIKKRMVRRSIDTLADRYREKLQNAFTPQQKDIGQDIMYLLNGRSLKKLATYQIIYKDRMINDDNTISGINRYIDNMFNETSTIKTLFRRDHLEHYGYGYLIYEDGTEEDIGTFYKNNCVDENINPEFADFDKIQNLFIKLSNCINSRKQAAFDKKEQLCKKIQKNF